MRCISVRQPWAALIIHAGKNIENRSRATHVRGRVLIHASLFNDHNYTEAAMSFARGISNQIPVGLFLQHGGIIGSVEIVDCVTESKSPWFDGSGFGWVLANPIRLPFIPCKGSLGFFNAPDDVMEKIGKVG